MFIVLSTKQWQVGEVFVPSPNALLLIYLTINFENNALCALIAKTKNNQSQGWEATLSRVLYSCLICTYCLVFKIEVFNALQMRFGPSNTYLFENNLPQRNPNLKMMTPVEVLNIICLPQEPTSVGQCYPEGTRVPPSAEVNFMKFPWSWQ